jgi:hypothetical protein
VSEFLYEITVLGLGPMITLVSLGWMARTRIKSAGIKMWTCVDAHIEFYEVDRPSQAADGSTSS